MSKLDNARNRYSFASLDVDSGEESEEEPVSEGGVDPALSNDDSKPVKLTKTALKKAAKTARLERQQKKNAKNPPLTTDSPVPESTSSVSDSPPGSISNPVEVFEDEPELVPVPPVEPAQPQVPAPPSEPPKQIVPAVSLPEPQPLQHSPSEEPPKVYRQPDPEIPVPAADIEQQKKRQNVITRTLWTFIMIGGFLGLLLLGHAYMVLLVMVCQTLVYREVTALFSLTYAPSSSEKKSEMKNPTQKKKSKDPWSKTLNWYFFAVTNYFLYGESIIYYFKHVIFTDGQLLLFATHHRIISFTLYIIGFMGFVMSLKRGYLKQQFGLFCWVHMSLLLIVLSSHFIVNNILEGLIWFWVPASLVICNDVFAYIWGVTIGRTPLIALSPKKTVEGFTGAFFTTIVFGVLYGTYFMRFSYMICPVQELGVTAFSSVGCVPNPVFVWKDWQIWPPVANALSSVLGRQITTVPYAPYQFHLLVLSCFASLVAPFGGFFASGFKRAFDIKDFGQSIPGHGGMTDRMDCQFLMGVFTYVYYSSLIRQMNVTVGSALQLIVSGLSTEDQLLVIADLRRYLEGQGIKVPC